MAFGRIEVSLTGPTNRWYGPAVEFVEVRNRETDQRFRIELQAKRSLFVVSLPAGEYELARVQIGEGPFRGIGYISSAFRIGATDQATYLGTWKFSVSSPFYYRIVALNVTSELTETVAEMSVAYPDHRLPPVVSALPSPGKDENRLFEMWAYPRVKYFRRHQGL